MRIDAHQHFWNYDPVKAAWITKEMKNIQRDFLPEDLAPILKGNSIDGCVTVQVDQSESETHALLSWAGRNSFIKGIVGWIDLCSENLEARLEYFSQYKILKGFRHLVQAEEQNDFLLREDFCRGIRLLNHFEFTYDILIYPRHLASALQFVKLFPEQRLVIDHLAKPIIRTKEIKEWQRGIQLISEYKNVYCKLSGMVTEADWASWTYDDLAPYLDVVVSGFGIRRVMYGSDWPVCLVAASYRDQLISYQRYFKHFSTDEQERIFGNNACEFYNLV